MAAVLDRLVQISMVHTGRAFSRGDRWVAKNDHFGVTTYGKTNEEAIQRNVAAIQHIMAQMSSLPPSEIRDRLDKLNVQYEISDKEDGKVLFAQVTTATGQ